MTQTKDSATKPRALMVGVHVLDTLVRPVEEIPEGQGGALVEQIEISAAGTAGGAALVLARLGAQVSSAGVIGDDVPGELLVSLLAREGVDTQSLIATDTLQTSASVLPIRADGSRPALHVIGANALLSTHVPWEALDDTDFVHLGAPEFFGGDLAAQMMRRAREGGAKTSADSLGPGAPEALAYFEAVLPELDFLLPNDEQAMGWTGTDSVHDAARALVARGTGCVAITCGAEPTVVATHEEIVDVPVFEVEVVDTSGCGDGFSAGFLRGIAHGLNPADAARLGNAAAAHVARGLGTGAGSYTFESVFEFAFGRSA